MGDYNVNDAQVVGTVAAGQAYGGIYSWSATASAVPEPSSVVMTGLGLAGLAGYRLRRRARRS